MNHQGVENDSILGDESILGQDEYILGCDPRELERLHFQHKAWIAHAYALWKRAGLRKGQTVLDLGCGPGFTSFELAQVVGPTGRVIAREQSAAFCGFLSSERDRRGLRQVEPSLGSVETLELADASLDAVYSRWLFCWLRGAREVLALVTRAVRPGGVIVLQEYLDWAAMKHIPCSEAFERSVEACMKSWAEGGGNINVAEEIPAFAQDCGLVVEHFEPIARIGRVGSLEWRWLEHFFRNYLPKLVERGLLPPGELRECLAAWDQREGDDERMCLAPMMADILLRRPI
jgi:SAM-dependent methyltransferase